MKSVYFKTLGCKVNNFDTHALENQFKALGYEVIDQPEQASINIINTCSVTSKADQEARYLARRMRRMNPDSLIVATGCYAQTDSLRLSEMPEIDLVVPNQVKEQLSELIDRYQGGERSEFHQKLPTGVSPVKENRQEHFKSSATLFARATSNQTRAYLKVQDGCNGFCSYCLIPYARGQSRSVEASRVMTELNALMEAGTPEIVLTGIHIGDYGQDFEQPRDLASLIRQMIDAHPEIRIRISSLEPSEVTDAFIEAIQQYRQNICAHFHLPLQSGSDHILKLMRRTYSRQEYQESVQRLRAIFPEASVGADVIPGFPGESDIHFEETLSFCKELELSYLHVFPYSRRPNTRAYRMPGHLDPKIIQQRAQSLRLLSTELRTSFHRRFIDQHVKVLWENERDESGRQLGKTGNYLDVTLVSQETAEPRTRSMCKILGFTGKRLLVKPISEYLH